MNNKTKAIKLQSGWKTMEIDGKEETMVNINGALQMLLYTASDWDGKNILGIYDMAKEFILLVTKEDKLNRKIYTNILNCTDINKITEGMLMEEDIIKQMLYTIKYAKLTANKVATPLNNKIKQLQADYDRLVLKEKHTNTLWNSAIQNEAKANTELAECKKKHDKEVRVLEHKIADLEKELAQLKNK